MVSYQMCVYNVFISILLLDFMKSNCGASTNNANENVRTSLMLGDYLLPFKK